MLLRTHCQTSGASLTEHEPYNNIVRTTVEALAGVLGGTQSLHTNSFDEALALPSEFSMRIARNTQLILNHETGVTRTVDPLAGSYFLENLTANLIKEAQVLIKEVEDMGGMTNAVNAGLPKLRIEESAARRQSRIDRNEDTVIGVNKFQSEVRDEINILDIDNSLVRETQVARLQNVKNERDNNACEAAINELLSGANDPRTNLLGLAVDAARKRATVGEISDALESKFTRHRAVIRSITGVYGSDFENDDGYSNVVQKVKEFAVEEGRRPRMLVVKLGQDGHDRGAKIIATAFADIGFDVDIGPLFQTPEEAAKQAIENDVHVIGVSSQAAGHKTLVPALITSLGNYGVSNVIIVCGGVIPPKDYDMLKKSGVSAIYGPGTNIPTAAREIIELVKQRRVAAAE